MGRCGAAWQIKWLREQCATWATIWNVFGRTIPNWKLLIQIISLSRLAKGALRCIWRREMMAALELGGPELRRVLPLPSALEEALREADGLEQA